ncbi:MAG: hypothetical protein LBT41_04305 [Candidatus Methanoplasma sp.]|nr:hypothetical protein [Candidatus Methanoplasma sp.]
MVSERKRTNIKHGTILGAVVGTALFAMLYWLSGNIGTVLIIPFSAVMGYAMQYVRDEEE